MNLLAQSLLTLNEVTANAGHGVLLEGSYMTINEGLLDRSIRFVIGLVLLSLVFTGPQTAWGWLGVIPLATGLVGFCPLYRIFGLSTCPLPARRR